MKLGAARRSGCQVLRRVLLGSRICMVDTACEGIVGFVNEQDSSVGTGLSRAWLHVTVGACL